MIELVASFDAQMSTLAPFVLYIVAGGIIFLETGILLGFFLPGDSILFSAGLVAAAHGNVNIVILVSVIFLGAFLGDQVGNVLGRTIGRPYLDKRESPRIKKMIINSPCNTISEERCTTRFATSKISRVIETHIPETICALSIF